MPENYQTKSVTQCWKLPTVNVWCIRNLPHSGHLAALQVKQWFTAINYLVSCHLLDLIHCLLSSKAVAADQVNSGAQFGKGKGCRFADAAVGSCYHDAPLTHIHLQIVSFERLACCLIAAPRKYSCYSKGKRSIHETLLKLVKDCCQTNENQKLFCLEDTTLQEAVVLLAMTQLLMDTGTATEGIRNHRY